VVGDRRARGVVVFDLDGTLVDTSFDIVAAVNHVRQTLSLPALDRRAVLAEVGFGAERLLARTVGAPDRGALDARVAEFRCFYREHQGERSAEYPGVSSMIAALAADRFDLYVLSNKPHAAAVREVEIRGWGAVFREVWGGGSLPALKPDPVGVRRALSVSGVGAERGAMVGDMPVDVATGAAAGVRAFLVAWGFSGAAEADGRCAVVESSAALVDALRRVIPE
jgi:phosphoglycolate phosphatase